MSKYLALLILFSSCSLLKWQGSEAEGKTTLRPYYHYYEMIYMEREGKPGIWMHQTDVEMLDAELKQCRGKK